MSEAILVIYASVPQYQFVRFFWLWSLVHVMFTQTVCAFFSVSTLKVH